MVSQAAWIRYLMRQYPGKSRDEVFEILHEQELEKAKRDQEETERIKRIEEMEREKNKEIEEGEKGKPIYRILNQHDKSLKNDPDKLSREFMEKLIFKKDDDQHF